VSPLRGEKPIFGLLSKNNIDMAALRAGLPVTKNQYASPPEGKGKSKEAYSSSTGRPIERF